MPDYSIVSCISKPDVYDRCVLTSANSCRHGFDIEFVPILNSEGLYSASLALNVGLDSSRSDIIIICHQDVSLVGNWFEILEKTIAKLPDDWAILGSAGISLECSRRDVGFWGGTKGDEEFIVGSVWDDDSKLGELPYWNGIKEITKVHCVDECLFVLRKSTGLRFDPSFNGFHFYGVDICLQARAAGYGVYCADLPIVHYGKYSASFTDDSRYWSFFRKLKAKWDLMFPQLFGTHMHWADDEMTSYIPVEIVSEDGFELQLKSMGISKMKVRDG